MPAQMTAPMTAVERTTPDWIEASRRENGSAALYVDRPRPEGLEVEAGSAGRIGCRSARNGSTGARARSAARLRRDRARRGLSPACASRAQPGRLIASNEKEEGR